MSATTVNPNHYHCVAGAIWRDAFRPTSVFANESFGFFVPTSLAGKHGQNQAYESGGFLKPKKRESFRLRVFRFKP
jgi:hypothetical protein